MRHRDHRFEWTRAEFARRGPTACGRRARLRRAVPARSATTTPRSARRPRWPCSPAERRAMTRARRSPSSASWSLVGASGSGKSTFAARALRAVRGDLQRLLPRPGRRRRERPGRHRRRVRRAALHRRQAAGRRAAHGGRRHQRAAATPASSSSTLARAHDVLPVAIVLDLPEQVCAATATPTAPDRDFGAAS